MKVLLISEGGSEGHEDRTKPQALQSLVAKVLPSGVEYAWIPVRRLPRETRLTGRGFFALALRAMQYAEKKGFDALVVVTDADREPARLHEFSRAQDTALFEIPRALGIAVEAFDAWILADHQALSAALMRNIDPLPLPENFAGPKGSAKHPKQVCQRLVRDHQWSDSQAAFYEAVCRHADLSQIALRCPRGFEPFLRRLEALASCL